MADRIVREIHRILAAIEERLPPSRGLDRLLLPGELAELFQVEVKTLEAWRSRGLGPRFVKLGGREVRYRPQARDERTLLEAQPGLRLRLLEVGLEAAHQLDADRLPGRRLLEEEDGGDRLAVDLALAEDLHHPARQLADLGPATLLPVEQGAPTAAWSPNKKRAAGEAA